jgi:hypothetical protein
MPAAAMAVFPQCPASRNAHWRPCCDDKGFTPYHCLRIGCRAYSNSSQDEPAFSRVCRSRRQLDSAFSLSGGRCVEIAGVHRL